MRSFLKLIRWQNLLIIILTMVLMRYAVIGSLLSRIGVILRGGTGEEIPLALQMPWFDFILLVAATVLIAAAGYVINDYFDIRTDLINKGMVIVGTKVARRQAMMWHNIFNLAGVAVGFYLSWKAGYIWMGALFLVVSGLLYFYSATYKRQFLIGNIMVAFLTALVPLLVVFYEWPALYRFCAINTITPPDLGILVWWVGGFAFFAFITTMIREIIKDIEDFEGDSAYGRNTLPIVMGILTTKIVASVLIIITIALVYLLWFFFVNDKATLIYMSVMVVAPLAFAFYKLIAGSSKKQVHTASNAIKLVMINGILYSILVKAILNWNLL